VLFLYLLIRNVYNLLLNHTQAVNPNQDNMKNYSYQCVFKYLRKYEFVNKSARKFGFVWTHYAEIVKIA